MKGIRRNEVNIINNLKQRKVLNLEHFVRKIEECTELLSNISNPI